MKFDLMLRGSAHELIEGVENRILQDADRRDRAMLKFGKPSYLVAELVAEYERSDDELRKSELRYLITAEVIDLVRDACYQSAVDTIAITAINMIANGVTQEKAA